MSGDFLPWGETLGEIYSFVCALADTECVVALSLKGKKRSVHLK